MASIEGWRSPRSGRIMWLTTDESVVAASTDGKERFRVQRLRRFAQETVQDRVLQVSVGLVVASLWFALALDDARFLVLLPGVGVAIRRFRQLERDFVP